MNAPGSPSAVEYPGARSALPLNREKEQREYDEADIRGALGFLSGRSDAYRTSVSVARSVPRQPWPMQRPPAPLIAPFYKLAPLLNCLVAAAANMVLAAMIGVQQLEGVIRA